MSGGRPRRRKRRSPPPGRDKARWETDADLADLKALIRERANELMVKTRPVRLAMIGFSIGAFAVGIVVILGGLQSGDIRVQSLGAILEALTGVPVGQLRRIQRDIGKIIRMPVSLELRLKRCGWASRNRTEYEECLASTMDSVDELFRKWGQSG